MRRGNFRHVVFCILGAFLLFQNYAYAQTIMRIHIDESKDCYETTIEKGEVDLYLHQRCWGSEKDEVSTQKGNQSVSEHDPIKEIIVSQINKYDVVISEIYPNPSEGQDEWVEIYNQTELEISLDGWKIFEGAQKITNLEGSIAAGEYKIIYKNSLNNSGDYLVVHDSFGKVIDELSYGENTQTILNNFQIEKGESYVRDFENFSKQQLGKSFEVTPGKQNLYINNEGNMQESLDLKLENQTKDLSNDSVDNEDVVRDPEEPEVHKIKESEIEYEDSEVAKPEVVIEDVTVYPVIQITEVYANPQGNDLEGEFIELYNQHEFEVNLSHWELRDNKNTYIFGDISIAAQDYLIIDRHTSSIVLNNTQDQIELYNPNLELVAQVIYSESIEGYSYQFLDNVWAWGSDVTPGEENVFSIDTSNGEEQASNENLELTTISDLGSKHIKNQVRVLGVVTSAPGDLDSGQFYIADLHTQDGIQINYPKKEEVELVAGDYIEVTGVFGTRYTEHRIKLNSIEDIQVLDSGISTVPQILAQSSKFKDYEGDYILVQGKMYIKDETKNIYSLEFEMNELEIRVNEKLNISDGVFVEVSGILQRNKKGYFINVNNSTNILVHEEKETKVLPEVADEDQQIAGTINQKKSLKKGLLYTISITVLFFILSIYMLIKKKQLELRVKEVYKRLRSWYLGLLQQ